MPAEDVFLSYSHKDKKKVGRLAEQIEGRGLSVFWDDKLRVGEKWGDQLEEKLTQALAVVVVWSENAQDSDFVESEARRSKEADKYFPILVQPLSRQKLGLDVVQHGMLADWNDKDGLSRLLEDLTYFIDQRRPTPGLADPEPASGTPLTRAISRTVDRIEQLGQIQGELDTPDVADRPHCFVFECTWDDWPDALASSCIIRQIADRLDQAISTSSVEPTAIEIAGSNDKAVEQALRSKLATFVRGGSVDISAWIEGGLSTKVVYTSLHVGKSVARAQAKIDAIADYADSLKTIPGANRLVFLTACYTHDLGLLGRLAWKWALYSARRRGVRLLAPLEAISGEDTDGWANGFPYSWQQRFDVEMLRRQLWERLGGTKGDSEPYRRLEPDILAALTEAIRDPNN